MGWLALLRLLMCEYCPASVEFIGDVIGNMNLYVMSVEQLVGTVCLEAYVAQHKSLVVITKGNVSIT